MNNGSVRGFVRHRYTRQVVMENGNFGPDYPNRGGITRLTMRNLLAKEAARKAYYEVQALLKRIKDGRTSATTKLKSQIRATYLVQRHGFSLHGGPSYRHLHATKGFRRVPC